MADKVQFFDANGNVRSIDADKAADAGVTETLDPDYAKKTYHQEKLVNEAKAIPLGGVAAFAHGAESALSLGLGDVRDRFMNEALFGKEQAQHVQELKDVSRDSVHPFAHGLGTAAGIIAPALFSGGTAVAAEGLAGRELALLGAAGAEEAIGAGAVKGAQSIGQRMAAAGLGDALRYTPGGLVNAAGNLAERQVAGLLGEGFAGRVGSQIARGSTEGFLYGTAEEVSRNVAHDTPLTAERVLAAGGEGALMGGLVGGTLGAGSHLVGGLADRVGGSSTVKDFVTNKAGKFLGIESAELATEAGQRKAHGMMSLLKELGVDLGDKPEVLKSAGKRAQDTFASVRNDIVEQVGKEAPSVRVDFNAFVKDVQDNILREYRGTATGEKIIANLEKKLEAMQSHFGNPGAEFAGGKWSHVGEAANGNNGFASNLKRAQIEAQNLNMEMRAEFGTNPVKNALTPENLAMKRFVGAWETQLKNAIQRAEDMAPELKGAAQRYEAASVGFGTAKELEKLADKRIAMGAKSASGFDTASVMGAVASMNPHVMAAVAAKQAANAIVDRFAPTLTQKAYDMLMAGKLAQTSQGMDKLVRSGLNSFFGGVKNSAGEGVAAVRRKNEKGFSRADYEQAYNRTLQLTSPEHAQTVQKYAQIVAQTNPVVAENMVKSYQTASQYLKNSMPGLSISGMNLAGTPKMAGLSAQEMTFLTRDSLVKDPKSILGLLSSGQISQDAVDTLKAVYPNFYDNMIETTMEFVQDTIREGKELPFEKVIQLSTLTGQPMLECMEPECISAIQAAHNMDLKGPGRPRSEATDTTQQATAAATMTESEKIEGT